MRPASDYRSSLNLCVMPIISTFFAVFFCSSYFILEILYSPNTAVQCDVTIYNRKTVPKTTVHLWSNCGWTKRGIYPVLCLANNSQLWGWRVTSLQPDNPYFYSRAYFLWYQITMCYTTHWYSLILCQFLWSHSTDVVILFTSYCTFY